MSRGVIFCKQPQTVLKSKSKLWTLKKTKLLRNEKPGKQLGELFSLKRVIYDATVLEGIVIYGEEIADDFMAYLL